MRIPATQTCKSFILSKIKRYCQQAIGHDVVVFTHNPARYLKLADEKKLSPPLIQAIREGWNEALNLLPCKTRQTLLENQYTAIVGSDITACNSSLKRSVFPNKANLKELRADGFNIKEEFRLFQKAKFKDLIKEGIEGPCLDIYSHSVVVPIRTKRFNFSTAAKEDFRQIFIHETGHHIDINEGKRLIGKPFSDTEGFRNAYAKDIELLVTNRSFLETLMEPTPYAKFSPDGTWPIIGTYYPLNSGRYVIPELPPITPSAKPFSLPINAIVSPNEFRPVLTPIPLPTVPTGSNNFTCFEPATHFEAFTEILCAQWGHTASLPPKDILKKFKHSSEWIRQNVLKHYQ